MSVRLLRKAAQLYRSAVPPFLTVAEERRHRRQAQVTFAGALIVMVLLRIVGGEIEIGPPLQDMDCFVHGWSAYIRCVEFGLPADAS